MFSNNLWLILTISPNLCVRSSSDLSPVSNVMLGLIVTGGTGNTFSIIHSGLANFGSNPKNATSESETFSILVLISIGFILLSSSRYVVGFSTFIVCCFAWQCGHFFTFLNVVEIPFTCFFVLTSASSSVSSCSSSSSICILIFLSVNNFPHSLHVHLKKFNITSAYFTCIIGLANSRNPKCPMHSLKFPPHVLHLNPGSITPNLTSINPPSTGYPSLSNNSGVTIFAQAIFLTISGLNIPKIIEFIFLYT